jgi:hypothetical protein
MKMQKDDYETLKASITETLAKHPGIEQRYKDAGLSDMRFRWDTLHASFVGDETCLHWVCFTLHPAGLHDSHIDTALRSIFGHKS